MVQQRGRKSTAQLSVVSPLTPGQGRAQPPKGMPADETAVWSCIVGAMPDNWFSTSFHVLRCLCAHVANEELIAQELAKARTDNDHKALRSLTVMHDEPAQQRAADPTAASSEWGAEFRSDIGAALNDKLIDRAAEHGRPLELPPAGGTVTG